MSESTGKRQSEIDKDLQDECDQTKRQKNEIQSTICSANQTANQINYARTEYIPYVDKYNKCKTGN